jgi:hypothetical protein
MASVTQISQLAAIISTYTAIVDEYFKYKNLPPPSFEIDGSPSIMFPPGEQDVAAAHANVLSAKLELHTLMKGPTDMILRMAVIFHPDFTLFIKRDSTLPA